jgi:hypothetical protein
MPLPGCFITLILLLSSSINPLLIVTNDLFWRSLIYVLKKPSKSNSIGEAVFVMIASGVSVSYNALFLL